MSEIMTDIDPVRDLGLKGDPGEEELAGDAKSEELVREWLKEIEAAQKREKDYRKCARRVVALYEAEKKVEYQYNILYANTETMQPALYNSTPRPVVTRRFKDEDPLGMAAGKVCERVLSYLVDDGNALYTSFDDLMKQATLEALVPGRGLTWFKYDANIEKAEAGEEAGEVGEAEEGEELPEADVEQPEVVSYETVCGEEVPWDRFLHGFAKKWQEVPWIAREHFMTREELVSNFGDAGKKVPVTVQTQEGDEDDDSSRMKDKDQESNVKVAAVYEIWCKTTKEVLFVAPASPRAPLKVVADPLSLTGFYPCPRPMGFASKISSLLPISLYSFYEEQAKELNIITVRINKITAAMKVRGMYDSTVEAIEKVLTSEDNTLVAAENVAALLAQGNTLEKSIWLMPIEKLVAVLQQLYQQREQIKTVIHELTGLADIMRGSSQASETLGAQQLKNQWGTLRLKKLQKEVMRYARDCLRIMAEIAVSKLSITTIKAMTGLKYPTEQEKQQAKMVMGQVQQQAQATGQPPQLPPGLSEAANQPSWEELMAVLQNDTQRNYRIDIETNSTVDAEATEDKQDISELLNAMSQFLNGIGPMVKDGTMPFDVAQGILLAVVRRYRFGPELEDQLKKMQAPAQGGDPEEQKKKEEEFAKQQAEFAKQVQAETLKYEQQKAELDMQRKQFEMEQQLAQREMQMQQQFAQKELAMEKQFAQKELAFQQKVAEKEIDVKATGADQKLQLKTSAAGEQQKRGEEALRTKAQELSKRESAVSPEAIITPLKAALEETLTAVQVAVEKAAKTTKRAVKQKDGSWKTEVV